MLQREKTVVRGVEKLFVTAKRLSIDPQTVIFLTAPALQPQRFDHIRPATARAMARISADDNRCQSADTRGDLGLKLGTGVPF
jgi:hypothetical protein